MLSNRTRVRGETKRGKNWGVVADQELRIDVTFAEVEHNLQFIPHWTIYIANKNEGVIAVAAAATADQIPPYSLTRASHLRVYIYLQELKAARQNGFSSKMVHFPLFKNVISSRVTVVPSPSD